MKKRIFTFFLKAHRQGYDVQPGGITETSVVVVIARNRKEANMVLKRLGNEISDLKRIAKKHPTALVIWGEKEKVTHVGSVLCDFKCKVSKILNLKSDLETQVLSVIPPRTNFY